MLARLHLCALRNVRLELLPRWPLPELLNGVLPLKDGEHDHTQRCSEAEFHKASTAAREAAKLPTLNPHDLRRSAVRQLERTCVPRQVAMRLVGHKTESIYRRYAIVSESDVQAAGASLDALTHGRGKRAVFS